MSIQLNDDLKTKVSSDFLNQINAYLKEVNRSLTCSKEEKEFYIDKIKNGILVFIDENPDATMEDIRREIGDPIISTNDVFENVTSDEPEKIKKRIKVRKVIIIAAAIVVAIVGIIYASAFIIQNQDAPGTYEEIKQNKVCPTKLILRGLNEYEKENFIFVSMFNNVG